MAQSVATFFQKYLAQRADEVDDHVKTRRARLAAAALLVEVVNADGEVTDDERKALLSGVRARFSLQEGEAQDLLALAEAQARRAVDLHQFTSLINSQFSDRAKLDLVEELWRAAYSDKILHRHEEQLIRKVADLLYVPHTSMLAAKERVRSNIGQVESLGSRPF